MSGVIAHALEDTHTLNQSPEITQEWRDCFEALIFAGVEDEMLIEWVEHRDKGNVENHFIVPRIHLSTGKYFNPAPPSHVHDFSVLCNYLNAKYELASPTNLKRRKDINLTGAFDNKTRSERINVFKVYVNAAINSFDVKNRDELITLFREESWKNYTDIETVRVSKNYISIKLKQEKKAFRLKGFVFSDQFTSLEALYRSESQPLTQELSVAELKEQFDECVERRRRFNQRFNGDSSFKELIITEQLDLKPPQPNSSNVKQNLDKKVESTGTKQLISDLHESVKQLHLTYESLTHNNNNKEVLNEPLNNTNSRPIANTTLAGTNSTTTVRGQTRQSAIRDNRGGLSDNQEKLPNVGRIARDVGIKVSRAIEQSKQRAREAKRQDKERGTRRVEFNEFVQRARNFVERVKASVSQIISTPKFYNRWKELVTKNKTTSTRSYDLDK
ncbi:hypothetical protein A9264_14090 [Vibrio sp. UCD-FRSSP16_10]|nr:hypothetical protein A9260_14470 [Vibrio sp. UCD-FRSSP16_30]OBT20002.1 hypothetical protein A9264_14090 [Vibrio sp. UCD-FRSSP16_10]